MNLRRDPNPNSDAGGAPEAALAPIPRMIHQVFFSANGMPEELSANVRQTRKLNPRWRHRIYDERAMRDFIGWYYGARWLSRFDRVTPRYGAVKADIFRYLLMYRVGGVYLDIKSRMDGSLDDVLRPDDRFLLAHWANAPGETHEGYGIHRELRAMARGEFQQWHVISASGHPFLKSVLLRVASNLDRYNPVLHGVGQHGVLRLSGPVPYTLAIRPLLAKAPHRLIQAPLELGLTYSIYDGLAHRQPGWHYSDCQDSILRTDAATKTAAGVYRALKTVKAKLRQSAGRRGGLAATVN